MGTHTITTIALPLLLLLATAWQEGGCQKTGMSTNNGEIAVERLKTGMWGGEHISMDVTNEGARIEFDCANGTIDNLIELGRNGRFEVPGVYTKERGGPMRGASRPARFSGRVEGDDLTLTITLTEPDETLGTFSLKYGRKPRLSKCV